MLVPVGLQGIAPFPDLPVLQAAEFKATALAVMELSKQYEKIMDNYVSVISAPRQLGGILIFKNCKLATARINYNALRGADCSCFPWVKRVVGPAFFIGDGVMLLLAALAGFWSKPPESMRSAVLVLGAVVVFALVSYGIATTRQTGTHAPATITVDGRPYSLASGRVFLFFFAPQCMHCFDASKRMAQFHWGATRVVAIPVEQPQYAGQFLEMTGLRGMVTQDFELLKKVFGFPTYPYGIALQNGLRKASLTKFDDPEPESTLRKLGFIE